MTIEKEVYFCKKYDAHNRSYWYLYTLLDLNTEISALSRKLGKVNLYIGDKGCSIELTDDMLIYAIQYRQFSGNTQDERDLLHYNLTNHSKFRHFYKITEDVHCYVMQLNGGKAEVYKHFKNSKYSKMDLQIELHGKKIKYGDCLEKAGNSIPYTYLGNVYHSIKKTPIGITKFKLWLKENDIRIDNPEEMEIESKLIESEEILRYDNNN